MINITANFSQLWNPETLKNLSGLPEHCMNTQNQFSMECIYQTICPQFNDYIINMGIGILIFFLFMRWLKWWFFKYGYKKLTYNDKSPTWRYIGDLNKLNTRVYWDIFIENLLSKFMMGFIVVVVYLAKWGNYGN